MNLHIINIIIKREYLNKVKKKSFILITFLVPILFAAICALPSLIMLMAEEESKKVAVVDKSGIVQPFLENTGNIEYSFFNDEDPQILKTELDELGQDALLSISPLDTASKTVVAETYSAKPLGMDASSLIEGQINDAVEDYRIKSYGIEDLGKIIQDIRPDVRLVTYKFDKDGNESVNESGVYMMLTMFLGMLIYMFISMFCGMVMTSVIEEKASRVVEVLVSSVKATELLFGKIIGVALVALTQFFMWIALTLLILVGISTLTGASLMDMTGNSADPTAQMAQSMGISQEQLDATGMAMPDINSLAQPADSLDAASGTPTGMSAVISTLAGLDYLKLVVVFILYFVFGYLLYASLFAAIGSAVENEADTQQLALPLTIPLLIGFFISMMVYKSPDSSLVLWGSMIPFTSPMVMLSRVVFGVPDWQLILSLVLLIGTFALSAWVSAKIYKVGILMFGKKSSFKDLWKWLKLK